MVISRGFGWAEPRTRSTGRDKDQSDGYFGMPEVPDQEMGGLLAPQVSRLFSQPGTKPGKGGEAAAVNPSPM